MTLKKQDKLAIFVCNKDMLDVGCGRFYIDWRGFNHAATSNYYLPIGKTKVALTVKHWQETHSNYQVCVHNFLSVNLL